MIIADIFSDKERMLIQECVDYFKDENFDDWHIEQEPDHREFAYGCCYIWTKTIRVSKLRDIIDGDKEFKFVMTHELRHAYQAIKGKLKISWYTGRWDDELHDIGSAIDGTYFKTPWERDANGFAHACIGDYSSSAGWHKKAIENAEILF